MMRIINNKERNKILVTLRTTNSWTDVQAHFYHFIPNFSWNII